MHFRILPYNLENLPIYELSLKSRSITVWIRGKSSPRGKGNCLGVSDLYTSAILCFCIYERKPIKIALLWNDTMTECLHKRRKCNSGQPLAVHVVSCMVSFIKQWELYNEMNLISQIFQETLNFIMYPIIKWYVLIFIQHI